MRRERFQRETDIIERLEIAGSYNATFTVLSGVDLPALVAECEAFLRDTQPMWDDVFAEVREAATSASIRARPRAPMRSRSCARRDSTAFFPRAAMEREVRRQVAEMGVDADARAAA